MLEIHPDQIKTIFCHDNGRYDVCLDYNGETIKYGVVPSSYDRSPVHNQLIRIINSGAVDAKKTALVPGVKSKVDDSAAAGNVPFPDMSIIKDLMLRIESLEKSAFDEEALNSGYASIKLALEKIEKHRSEPATVDLSGIDERLSNMSAQIARNSLRIDKLVSVQEAVSKLSERVADVEAAAAEAMPLQSDAGMEERISDLEEAMSLLGGLITNIDSSNKSTSTNVMTRVQALEQRFVDMAEMARNMKRGGAP